jgi:hypothetical protein
VEYGDGEETPSLTYKNIDIHVTAGRDLNNDGTEDADQPQVADLQDGEGKWTSVVIDAGAYDCEVLNAQVMTESSLNFQDANFDYPKGLVDFSGSCDSPSSDSDIHLYFYDTNSDNLKLRKYDPNIQTYEPLTDANLVQQTINGHNVVVATYHMFDGSALDTDGGIDGQFSDPVGIASEATLTNSSVPAKTTDLAKTGESTSMVTLLALVVLISTLALAVATRDVDNSLKS